MRNKPEAREYMRGKGLVLTLLIYLGRTIYFEQKEVQDQ
jgi:hypothetical protein